MCAWCRLISACLSPGPGAGPGAPWPEPSAVPRTQLAPPDSDPPPPPPPATAAVVLLMDAVGVVADDVTLVSELNSLLAPSTKTKSVTPIQTVRQISLSVNC